MTAPDQPTPHRAWTRLGAVSAPRRAAVDTRGLVTPDIDGGGWSLDWWVGADDRWHLPQEESSVRQQLVGESPVVETAMRVPGGDAVHRAYVVHGEVDRLVVEIENRSAVPFALALAVRPSNPLGSATVGTVELVGTDLLVDGAVGVQLPKVPARAAGRTGSDGDVLDLVIGGGAPVGLSPVHCSDGAASAAVIFPLPHTAVLRVALPLPLIDATRSSAVATAVADLPSAERVAKGWEAQVRRGMRIVVPADSLGATVEANRGFLLVAHAGDRLAGEPHAAEFVATMGALDQWGFHDETGQVLAAAADEPASGAVMVALAEHWRLTRDRDLVDHLSPALAAGVSRLARVGRRRVAEVDRWRVPGLEAAAELLVATGQARAAASVRRRVDSVAARLGDLEPEAVPPGWKSPRHIADQGRHKVDAGDPAALDALGWLLSTAGPRRTWPALVRDNEAAGDGHDLAAGAAFLALVRSMLVREVSGGLALGSVWPVDWLGQSVEVHDAPTAHGRLSFAVRWHGARPALLWDLAVHQAADGTAGPPVTLVAPSLDSSWASRDPRGEALLARPPEPAGGAGPEEGASFS